MNYLNISFTHKNTDIAIREKLSFTKEKQNELLKLATSSQSVVECMILSTCNRVEILAFVNDLEKSQSYLLKVMSILSGVGLKELESRADIYYASGALHHLFSVASSLDSLVVGETQIVGQLKSAFRSAFDDGFAGEYLKRAVDFSFKCAAKVRAKTEISKNPVSVSSVAVAKAKDIFGSLDGKSAVVVGAGHMSELACRHLLSSGADIILVNRNETRARNLIDTINSDLNAQEDTGIKRIKYAPYSKLKELINSHSLIFSATSASLVIIDDSMIERRDFDRYFFDIAVPRDIDIKESLNLKVYSVDDLQEIVKLNLAMREEQAEIAYSIVGNYTNEFFRWLRELSITPAIKALRLRAKEVANLEIEKALKKGYLKNSDESEARKLVHQVFKAFLHAPTINLKSLDTNAEDRLAAVIEIFDIADEFEEFSKELDLKDILK